MVVFKGLGVFCIYIAERAVCRLAVVNAAKQHVKNHHINKVTNIACDFDIQCGVGI